MKSLERALKLALAWAMAVLLWRPGRRQRAMARLETARRILLVRLDDRVGEALLTTPLVQALAGREVHAAVHPRCVRVLEGLPGLARLWAYDGRWKWLGPLAPGVRALKAQGFEAVVDCGNWAEPSVTAMLISRLIASDAVAVGPAVGPGRAVLDVPVAARADTQSERLQRLHLLSPLKAEADAPMSFRPLRAEVPREARVVVNPGGRLDHRRVAPAVFAQICRALIAQGRTPIVTWGPGEEALAREVVAGAQGSVLAGATDLDGLGALMRAGGLTICNNTGPMHLSVALGVPTIGLFVQMPVARWGHPEAPHQMVDLTDVPDSERAAQVDARSRAIAAVVL